MPIPVFDLSLISSASVSHRGRGYFSGLAPDPGVPGAPDGRYRLLNEPAQGLVVVYEARTMVPVASTLSAVDGTWRIAHLNPDVFYTVVGFDGRGIQNAAIQDWVKPALPE